jgi:esterase/lipase
MKMKDQTQGEAVEKIFKICMVVVKYMDEMSNKNRIKYIFTESKNRRKSIK